MRILLVCDGGGPVGVGHVMRSLALAEAGVAAGHEVMVAGRLEGSFVQDQLAAAPVEVAPGPVPEVVLRWQPDVLHVDSYDVADRFGDSPDVDDVRSVHPGLLRSNMEDGSFGRRAADVVIDPTVGAELSPRPDDGSGLLLRGCRYTPIRKRVLESRQVVEHRAVVQPREAEVVGTVARSVLVVMGGTDPVGLAPTAVGLLAATGLALDVTVIAVDEKAELVRRGAVGSALSLQVLPPVDDLAALMAEQDLVVSAAGISMWELCCIGVPMAVVLAVDNQRVGYQRVVAAGAAIGLGGPDLGGADSAAGRLKAVLTDPQARSHLVLAGRRLVDGLGAWRVVRTWEMAVRQAQGETKHQSQRGRALASEADSGLDERLALVARPATVDDARVLWEWRNDPATRAGSRSSEPVLWPDHLSWVEASLTREDRILLVVEDASGPAGTVRWDRDQEADRERERPHECGWEVSITVAPGRRGQSLARPILRAGERALTDLARPSGSDVTAHLAVVHVDNASSVRLFESSGYLPDLPPDPRGFMRFRKAARVA